MKIKALFITVFPAIADIIWLLTVIDFFTNGFSFQILGNFICSGIIAGSFLLAFISGNFKKGTATFSRNNRNLPILTAPILIGFVIAMIGFGGVNEEYNISSAYAIVNTLNWILYITWYSGFRGREKNNILKVGLELPVFTLENAEREKYHLLILRERRLSIFFTEATSAPYAWHNPVCGRQVFTFSA